MDEIWVKVIGWEDFYEVSNRGRLRSYARIVPYINSVGNLVKNPRKELIRKPGKDKGGYLSYILSDYPRKKLISAHRLVATHFVENPNNYPEINHIDGNKENNYYKNLEWCTRSQNVKHAFDMGLKAGKLGIYNHRAVFTVEEVLLMRNMHGDGMSPRKISEILNKPYGSVQNIVYFRSYNNI